MRFVLVVGTTRTAEIDGISAAGAAPELLAHTPAADAELVAYGRTLLAPHVPVSPSGCPTPAVVTRDVRDVVGFDLLVVDAGLATPTGAPTVDLPADPGGDIRAPAPVPAAAATFDAARDLARTLPDERLVIGESIPGGTTTALGVFAALGEPFGVSSSLAENPLERKRAVVGAGLEASGLARGDAAGDPSRAVRRMGDPVLAAVTGLTVGATDTGTGVTLAGGTQLLAAAALARHAGVTAPIGLATTSFVAADETADVRAAADDLALDLTVTDPGFDQADHVAMARYVKGEAKEGVGMGGALALADRADASMAEVRDRIVDVTETLAVSDGP